MVTEFELAVAAVERCLDEWLHGDMPAAWDRERRLGGFADIVRRSPHIRREHLLVAVSRFVRTGKLSSAEAASL